jgi:tetratricopeptide (TPR) repeat protein
MAKKNILTHSKKKKAESLLQNSQLLEANQLYASICQLDKMDADAWLARGVVNMRLGVFNEAEACCRHLLAIGFQTADIYYLLGSSLESQKRLSEALAAYNKALQLKPDHVDVRIHHAMVLQALGKPDDAAISCRKALELRPNDPALHYNLGVLLNELNQPEEAEESYKHAIKLDPHNAHPYANLGYVQRKQKKTEEAVENYRQAAKLDPKSAEIHHNFGLAFRDLNRLEDASGCQKLALQLNPHYEDAYLELASIYQISGDIEEAKSTYTRALQADPENPRLRTRLAGFLQTIGEYPEALTHYQQALRIQDNVKEVYHDMGSLFSAVGNAEQAIQCYRKAIEIDPDFAKAYVNLGSALLSLGFPEQAEACGSKALELQPDDMFQPDNIEAMALLAIIKEHQGEQEEAYKIIEPLLNNEILDPNVVSAFSTLSKALRQTDKAVSLLEKSLENGASLPTVQRCKLHFSLGKLYDSMERYDEAFSHYAQGNRLKFARYSREDHRMLIDSCISTFSSEFMGRAPRSTIFSELPVFIVGMPRSGTSLVEQILATHPAVHGAGELIDVDQIARSREPESGDLFPNNVSQFNQEKINSLSIKYLDMLRGLSESATRITDKMPGNFIYLGFIELLFPNARIIHCKRDPLDTCLSCYFQNFNRGQAFSFDLSNLGIYYREYLRLMEHWKKIINIPFMEVQYEDLVENQEVMSRKIIEFCGLDWNDDCMRFYETKRYVATASYDQVRRPIYKKSVERWKYYDRYLDPLKAALE